MNTQQEEEKATAEPKEDSVKSFDLGALGEEMPKTGGIFINGMHASRCIGNIFVEIRE